MEITKNKRLYALSALLILATILFSVILLKSSSSAIAVVLLGLTSLFNITILWFFIKELITSYSSIHELKKHSEYLRVTLNSIEEGVITTDVNGNIQNMNPSASRLTQWQESETIGLPLETVYNVVNESTGKPIENIVHRILRDGKPIEFENNTILFKKNAQRIIISNSGSPINAENGTIVGSVLVFKDISQRKYEQEELINANKHLQSILNQSLDIICTANELFEFITMNAASETLLGFTPEEMIGKSFMDFIVEEDKGKTLDVAVKIANGEFQTNFENRFIHKDGSEVPLIWSSKWDDKTKMFYALARDGRQKISAEKKLLESERRYRAMIEKSADLKALFDRSGSFLFVSPSFLKGLGYTHEEVSKMTLKDITHPKEYENLKSQFLSISEFSGTTFQSPFRLMHKTGEWRYCEGSVTNHIDVPGIHAFVTNFRDITEIRKSNEAIKLLNNRMLLVSQSAGFGIWDWDIQRNILLWDDEMHKIYNSNPKDFKQKNEEWVSAIHPEDRDRVLDEINVIIQKDNTLDSEYRIVWKDGTIRYLKSTTIVERDEDGIAIRLTGINEDITERKLAEIQLKQNEQFSLGVLNSLSSEIAVIDHNGVIVAVSETWKEFSASNNRLEMGNTLVGANYLEVCKKSASEGDEDAMTVLNGIQLVIDRKLPEFYGEYPCHAPPEKRWFSMRVTNFDSEADLVVVEHQNITALKLAEFEKEKMTYDLIQRNKNIEQFSYILSHNMRAPLANILGFSELMQFEDNSVEEVKEIVVKMSESANILDTIIKDLNKILQVGNQLSENKEDVDLNVLVEDIKISIANIFENQNVVLETDFTSIQSLSTVRVYMHSIFYNLIYNSIKYKQKDIDPVISIKSKLTENGVQLLFKDNGIGIDMEKHGENVFGLYRRFHPEIKGKGIGLYMVKSQVEALGGTIHIQSEVNKGTEFKIFLNRF